MIKTDKYNRLAVGADGLLRVNITDITGAAIDAELYEFRVELYGKEIVKDKPAESEISDEGKYIISYDGENRVNNVVIDGELYFIIDKYTFKPTYIYYSQYESYEVEGIYEPLQRACHGKLDFSITYFDCPKSESQTITISALVLKGTDGTDGTDGTNGTNGTDGESAYQTALRNGFVGTEAEWLQSLKGSDGTTPILDTTPTDESTNAVTSGGVKSALDNKANIHDIVYDQIIRTQEEFETLIASDTWLGATSVAFVGDGGTLKFTQTGDTNIVVPDNIREIYGFNGAEIYVVQTYVYDSTTGFSAVENSGNSLVKIFNLAISICKDVSYADYVDYNTSQIGLNLYADFFSCNINIASSAIYTIPILNANRLTDSSITCTIDATNPMDPCYKPSTINYCDGCEFTFTAPAGNGYSVWDGLFSGFKSLSNTYIELVNIIDSDMSAYIIGNSMRITNCHIKGYASAPLFSNCQFMSNCIGENVGSMYNSTCSFIDTATVGRIES